MLFPFSGKVSQKDVTTFIQRSIKVTSKITTEFVQWAQKQLAIMNIGK